MGQCKQVAPQLIVHTNDVTNRRRWEAFQKPAQGRLFRELRQSQQGQKCSVVLEHLGLVQPAQSCNDGEQQRHDHVGRLVFAMRVGQSDRALQSTAKVQAFAKTLHQHHSTEVGQMGVVERKTQGLQAFAYGPSREKLENNVGTETSLKGRFLSKHQNVPFDRNKQGPNSNSCYQLTLF